MSYSVFFEEKAKRELARIERPYQKLIRKKIDQLAENFDSLSGNLKLLKRKFDYYRLRVGHYRVIFHKDDVNITIIIVRIGHRKKIYESF